MQVFTQFSKGIALNGLGSDPTDNVAGSLWFRSDTKMLHLYDGTGVQEFGTDAGTQTFTNKTLTGNTAANLISGSGVFIFNTTGTVTVPGTTDTLVGKATTDILTNKTIDASSNTLSNIVNASIGSSAAIARSKIASADANYVVINDGSGGLTDEAHLALSRGGTGIDNSSVVFPSSGTLVTTAGSQTLTNKTLTAPIIATVVPTGGVTITFPTSASDTLVGKATTDTLLNKTISGAFNTLSIRPADISSTLTVAVGGTGVTSLTNHGVLIGAGSGGITQLNAAATGTVLVGQGASSDPSFSANPSMSSVVLNGSSSGSITLLPQTAAGTYNFNLPTTAGSSGQLLSSGGGSSSPMTWVSALANPMTTGGDIIYGGSAGAVARLANGTAGQFLTSSGTTLAPTWTTLTYKSPTFQKFTSGTTQTYTLPTSPSPIYIKVRMVAGGGGGAGGGTSPGNGGSGGNTIFAGNTANGGSGGVVSSSGAGGTAGTISTGTGFSFAGQNGAYVGQQAESVGYNHAGGVGGGTPFSGGGMPQNGTGQVPATNSGAGGGGGLSATTNASTYPGSGGGAGNYMEYIISSPASTYTYTVGGGGSAGSTGTNGFAGGAGASGFIVVEEYYQ